MKNSINLQKAKVNTASNIQKEKKGNEKFERKPRRKKIQIYKIIAHAKGPEHNGVNKIGKLASQRCGEILSTIEREDI